jgi:hypothetical protein
MGCHKLFLIFKIITNSALKNNSQKTGTIKEQGWYERSSITPLLNALLF